MKVLICGFYPGHRYGLAVAYLKSHLDADPALAGRVETSSIGFMLSDHDSRAVERIRKASPDVLAFSCYVWNITKVLRVCRALRARGFSGPIVLGGPEVTYTAARTLEDNPEVSVVVRGEVRIDVIYGLPGDDLRTYRASLDYALSRFPDVVQIHTLLALPGTEFHHDAARLGLEYDRRPPYVVRRTPTFRPADFVAARKAASAALFYNRFQPVKLAAALARAHERGLLAWLEALARCFPPKPFDDLTFKEVGDALERFFISEEAGIPEESRHLVLDFTRYHVFGRSIGRLPSRGGPHARVLQLQYDFSTVGFWKELLDPELRPVFAPKKANKIVYDHALADVAMNADMEPFLPKAPAPEIGPLEIRKRTVISV